MTPQTLFIFVLLSILPFCFCDYSILIEFLKDYFQENRNVRFTLYLCWPKHLLIELFVLAQYSQTCILRNGTKLLEYSNTDHKHLRIMDSNCPDFMNLIQEANNRELFIAPNKWLIINCNSSYKFEKFNQMDWLLDSEVTFIKCDENNKIVLNQYYKYSVYDSELVVENYGYWSFGEHLVKIYTFPVTSYRRKNLHGKILNASYVVNFPSTLNHLDDYGEPHQDSLTKHSYLLNKILIDYVNATMAFKITSSWGVLLENGSWTGIMDKLIRKEDAISGTSLLLTPVRFPHVHYLCRNSKTRMVFIFRKPPLSYVNNILLLSFQKNVWLSVILLSLVTIIMVYITVTWEMKLSRFLTDSEYPTPALEGKFSDICLFVLGGICQQGSEAEPRSNSGRITLFIILLSLMFLYTSYSANIVGLLQSSSDSIKTIEDLLDSPLQLGVIENELGRSMRISTDPIRMAIHRKIGLNGLYSDSDGVKRMQKGLFGFLNEAGPIYYFIAKIFQEHEKCDLQEVPLQGPLSLSTYVIVPKKSPYLETFKVGYLKIEEFSLQQRIFAKIYNEKPLCGSSVGNFVAVGLTDTYWAFLIWGYGVFMAVIVILIEKMYEKIKKSNKI